MTIPPLNKSGVWSPKHSLYAVVLLCIVAMFLTFLAPDRSGFRFLLKFQELRFKYQAPAPCICPDVICLPCAPCAACPTQPVCGDVVEVLSDCLQEVVASADALGVELAGGFDLVQDLREISPHPGVLYRKGLEDQRLAALVWELTYLARSTSDHLRKLQNSTFHCEAAFIDHLYDSGQVSRPVVGEEHTARVKMFLDAVDALIPRTLTNFLWREDQLSGWLCPGASRTLSGEGDR